VDCRATLGASNSAFATVQITTDLLTAVHQEARLIKLSYQSLIPMQLDQALSVIAMSFFVSILTEFISWLLVYRSSNYRRIKDDLDRQAKKFEQYKQQTGPKKDGSEKKEKKLEEGVKSSIRDYQAIKMKANMVTGLVNLLVLNRLLAAFEGTPGMQGLASNAGPASLCQPGVLCLQDDGLHMHVMLAYSIPQGCKDASA
jgi:hypothetical protein